MSSDTTYCTYLVTYSGDKLPTFYIGSTSTKNIYNGYFGSVSSKKWKQIYRDELLKSPEKFKIKILETFASRKEALEAELKLHIENDVVKSSQFINEALATINGFFGRPMNGEKNPMHGKSLKDLLSLEQIEQWKQNIRSNWKNDPKIWMHNFLNVNARISTSQLEEAIAQGYSKGYAKGTSNLNRKGIKLKPQKDKFKFINNGVINRKIKFNDQLPEGWTLGCIKGYKMKPRVDKEPTIVITDETCTKRIKLSEQIPSGWKRGRHYSLK